MKSAIVHLWQDPVWSKVIATLIAALVIWIFKQISSKISQYAESKRETPGRIQHADSTDELSVTSIKL